MAVGLVVELYRYVSQTNAQLVRFLAAARSGDSTWRFEVVKDDSPISGPGFSELAQTLNEIM